MTKSELLTFLRQHRFVVAATASTTGAPQAAVVGVVFTGEFDVIFDTLDASRKFQNLISNGRVAIVVGGTTTGDERTVQYEGIAYIPAGADLEQTKNLYLARFKDGTERVNWPGLVYVRVKPRWIRYSDFAETPPRIVEFTFHDAPSVPAK